MKFHKEIKILLVILMAITFAGGDAYSIDYSGSDVVGIESIVADITTPSDETWRLEANQRIDQTRKANMDIVVLDELTGLAIPDVEIDIKLTRHQFRFGGVTRAKTLEGVDATITEQLYKDTFLSMGFNASGFNNAFKLKQEAGQGPYIPGALQWLQDQDVTVRGHCLIWPGTNSTGKNHLTPTVTAALDLYNADPTEANRDALRTLIEDEMIYWASKWDVVEWDVINEERGNHDIMDIFGDEVMVDWFNIAKQYSVDPKALFLLNEFQIISDMVSDTQIVTSKITEYKNTVDFLLANNAPLTALGFQSRFGNMPSADVIYQRLQQFDEYNLPITATEFEMKDNIVGDLNKAIMTERVMTVYFSHHLVNGIYVWSFFPGDGREIVDINGAPNLRGKTWLYLTKKHWITDETLISDQSGNASVRGFKGDYDITVHRLSGEKTVQVSLDQDSYFEIIVPSGDSDLDGVDDIVEGIADLDYDGTPDYLDAGTFPLSFAQEEIVTQYNLHDTEKGTSDAMFRANADFDDFDGTASSLAQCIFDIGGAGDGDGLSLVYGPGNELILTICGSTSSRTETAYALTPEQVAAGMLELTAIVDIDYLGGNGTDDLIQLFVDRAMVASISLDLADNDFINSNKSGFGMTGGNATGGWPGGDDALAFTSGTIDYARGLWYCDDISGIDLGWCPEANIDGVNNIDGKDFNLMASNWQLTGTDLQGDINKDSYVDSRDLIIMASNWLSDCSQ